MREWPAPPDAVWVWGQYRKYQETYCSPDEIKQEGFDVPVTKYVRIDLVEKMVEGAFERGRDFEHDQTKGLG